LVAFLSLVVGCRCIFGEQAGIFYLVHFDGPPPNATCASFANSVATKLNLNIVELVDIDPLQKDACYAMLRDKGEKLAIYTNSFPRISALGIAIHGSPRLSSGFAPQILDAAHEYFAGKEITEEHPCNDILGP
jgi:hypothetical protein